MNRCREAFLAALALVAAVALLTGCGVRRLGVVDTNRILNESARALRYQRQLDEQEKTAAADLRLLIGRIPPADVEARRVQYLKELQEAKEELEKRLNQEIREVVAQLAREHRLRQGVLVKGSMVHAATHNTVDLTDEVIQRLR